MCPRPVSATRDALLCVGCGSSNYYYDTPAGGEPGARVCADCGVVQNGRIIFDYMYGRTVPSRSSNYKRIHHWHERISQLLLMESAIPPKHMLQIGQKLATESYTVLSKDSIRAVLRSLGLQVYIEKWLQIIERLTGVMPPCPGPMVLEQLDSLFLELQRPFSAHKAENRRNFLNYNYVFCRLFQKMNCTKFCMFFPLIRSKMKMRALDEMWNAMATSIDWEVTPLQSVVAFSVKLPPPELLLQHLQLRVALEAPVVPRPMLPKRESRMLGLRLPGKPLPKPTPRHLVQSEPPLQTLALRLKRKRSTPASPPRSPSPEADQSHSARPRTESPEPSSSSLETLLEITNAALSQYPSTAVA